LKTREPGKGFGLGVQGVKGGGERKLVGRNI